MFKFSENWLMYRTTSENLKREESFFLTRTSVYNGSTDDEAFNTLVQNVESYIQSDNNKWVKIHKVKDNK